MDMQTSTDNPLKSLEQLGQSPWLDFIERDFLVDGLQPMIDRDGLKGHDVQPVHLREGDGPRHEL